MVTTTVLRGQDGRVHLINSTLHVSKAVTNYLVRSGITEYVIREDEACPEYTGITRSVDSEKRQ